MNSKQLTAGLIVSATVLTGTALWYWSRGVAVTLRNVGVEPLRAVVLQATGFSSSLGDIGPGQSRRVSLTASGESHLEVEHRDGPRLIVRCYFEGGNRGSISVDVATNKIVRQECKVRAAKF